MAEFTEEQKQIVAADPPWEEHVSPSNGGVLIEAPDDGPPLRLDEIAADIEDEASPLRRKPKVSRISATYDPTPEYGTASSGHERPTIRCWVDRDIARPISISELHPLWRDDPAQMGTKERKERFLATKVVSVNGEFYVKDKGDRRWVCRKQREVKSVIMNDWGRDLTEFHIGQETVTDFLAGELVVLEATAYIPGAGDFVRVQGRACLNTWSEPPMSFAPDAMLSDEFELLLSMVVQNLVGVHDGGMAEWIEEITGTQETPLRWFFHWIASNYQRPGKNLPTALWIVGRNQGVGKGLFSKGMASIVGARNTKWISVEELRGEWTDWIANASLHIGDEIDLTQRKDLYDRTKRIIGNPVVSIRKRHEGVSEVPAVANYLFTTNDISPLSLDKHDRRHSFFETRGGDEAKQLAEDFYELGDDGRRVGWEGLAEFLNAIEIDDKFISTAVMTDVKREMIEINRNPVEDWINSDEMLRAWPPGYFAKGVWLGEQYEKWAKDRALPPAMKSSKYFNRMVAEISRTGSISRQERPTMEDGSKPRGYVRLDPISFPAYEKVSDLPVAPRRSGSSPRVEDMKEKIKSRSNHLKVVHSA